MKKGSSALSDGEWREFEITEPVRLSICAGSNPLESRQLHLGRFRLSGDVIGPRESLGTPMRHHILDSDEARDSAPWSERGDMVDIPKPAELVHASIQHVAVGLQMVVELVDRAWRGNATQSAPRCEAECHDDRGSGEDRENADARVEPVRFGSVRVVSRAIEGGFEYFPAKHDNAREYPNGLAAFAHRVRGLVALSHPYVMPIVGLIPPTKTAGPIVLTPYSELGSLFDVLERVRRNDPPSIWNDAGKLRLIVSLISGFEYLHSQGVVQREVKPSDLIVQSNGSIRICGYLMSVLEEHKFTRASQVGAPLGQPKFPESEDGRFLVWSDPTKFCARSGFSRPRALPL